MNRAFKSSLVLIGFSLSGLSAFAQVQRGTPPFGSFGGGPDVINLGNLNVHLAIPVIHKPGRGQNFNYDIVYDSSVWYPVTVGGTTTWQPDARWGWSGTIPTAAGYATYQTDTGTCRAFIELHWITEGYTRYYNWVYVDGFGTSHHMVGAIQDGSAPDCGPPEVATLTTNDGSGYKLSVPDQTLYTTAGAVGVLIGQTFTDRNGNKINVDGTGHLYDTLSSSIAALTVVTTGSPATQTTYTYTAPSGVSAVYTMIYSTLQIQTNFGCTSPSVGEYGTNGTTTANLVTEIRLPDYSTNPNSKYTFTYEDTPSHTGYVTGRLKKVTLPTGGYISYTYTAGGLTGSDVGASDPIGCADGSAAGFQRIVNDGTTSNTWTYSRSRINVPTETNHWQTKVTTPPDPTVGNDTVIDFQKDANATDPTRNFYETQRAVYQGSSGSGTLMQTTSTCYNNAASPCTTTTVSSPITQRDLLPSIPSAASVTLKSKHTTKFNSVGGTIEVDDYAFGSGAIGGLLRQTLITYASLPPNITAFKQTVTVKNGAGTVIGQTNYNYDQTTPVAAPTGTAQLTSISGSRGNLTSIQRCTNLTNCSTSLQTTMTYDTAGQVQTLKDPMNNQTSFTYYPDKFYDDNGANPPQAHAALSNPTDAYVTKVTLPNGKTLNNGYYFYSGQLAAATDQNGTSTDLPANTSYTHFDSIGRLSSTFGPTLPIAGSPSPGNANPWTLIKYTSQTQVDTYADINDTSTTAVSTCTVCRQDRLTVDGLGRALHSYLISDPEGQTEVDTVYDSLGRVQSSSHPHRTASSTTDGTETPTYDALSRTTKVTHQDTTFSQTLYGAAVTGTGVNAAQLCNSATYGLGFPVVTTDEAGKKRELWTDALGRTIEGDEPDSAGALNSKTCYSYDPLGNLLGVAPGGTQNRTYVYDTLSRVTSVTTPEAGTTNFYYTTSGGALCSGNPSAACRRTDARAITTTYSYDSLNRLTQISYSATTQPTPTVQYAYDGNTLSGCTTTPPTLTDSNPKGHMTAMCDGSGATSWAHDAAGRSITETRKIVGTTTVTQTLSYSYNLNGSIANVTYPSGKVVTYSLSNAQRLTAAKDVSNNIQFATAASYVPPGALSALVTGQISGGFTGISETHNYNNSLEYTTTKATSTAGTAMDITLTYNLVTGGDNGTVTTITNNADNGRTLTLGYDSLNRISSATTQATSGVDCWGESFVPDALANLNTITATQCAPPGTLSVSVDANNHIITSGFGYDAAGNMTSDGSTFYTFDAENRLTLAPGVGYNCYIYDGLGLRVAKKSGTNNNCSGGTYTKLYWRSLSGDALTETDGTGSVTANFTEYVFFAGRRVASRVTGSNSANTAIFYYFADQLGSTRTITTGSGKNNDGTNQTPGQLCWDQDYTPYGQEFFATGQMTRLQTTACPPSYKFTGYERDSETGLDYAFARYYSSRLGRFLSADPLGGSIGDLQSHNAYAYTRNNPLNATDARGMSDCPDIKIGCMPSDECLSGGICGAPGVDLFGASCRHLDFWGGDCAAVWHMLDPSGRHQSQMLADEARYDSIVNTGWDPELGIQYYTYSFAGGCKGALQCQMQMAAIQFGQQACAGQAPSAVADCIVQVYNQLAQQGPASLEGGNYHFAWADQNGNLLIQINGQFVNPKEDFGCAFSRCGRTDTLDYSHPDGTFHIDTANPWFFPIGTVVHTIVDVLGGSTWWSGGIPRFP